jgi:hypothetical protein
MKPKISTILILGVLVLFTITVLNPSPQAVQANFEYQGNTLPASSTSTAHESSTAALVAAFTYQGQLKQNGQPVDTACDFQFGLKDAASGGNPVGSTLDIMNLTVTKGLFTTELDFGSGAFNGEARWLEIAVRCPAGEGSYTTLGLQALTAAPYASYAGAAGEADTLDGKHAAELALPSGAIVLGEGLESRLTDAGYLMLGSAGIAPPGYGGKWATPSTTDAPSGRIGYTAVWSGSEMIVWGGDNGTVTFGDGGRYNPTLDSWQPITTTNAPIARTWHTAIWTGSEMIVWGGSNHLGSVFFADGARYNPATDTWTSLPASGLAARVSHNAVWTGSEMILWGGNDAGTSFSDGARYNPATNSWSYIPSTGAPSGRQGYGVVWTGSEMIVWGGVNTSGTQFNDGSRYNPISAVWTPLPAVNLSPRHWPSSVWTGSEMIIWGGWNNSIVFGDGARYDPLADAWLPVSMIGAPGPSSYNWGVWTGSDMIIWSGYCGSSCSPNSGGRYNPASNTWTALSIGSARSQFRPVWTGTEMIFWGGYDASTSSHPVSGGRFFPYLNLFAKP